MPTLEDLSQDNHDTRPVPDPTELTTRQLMREIEWLRQLLETNINAQQKTTALQFAERDTRVEKTAADNKIALSAALQAAKEIVEQQNEFFTKQIDQQAVQIVTAIKSLEGNISDLKDRVTANEGRTLGLDTAGRKSGDMWGYVVAGGGLLVALITLLVSIIRAK